MKKLRVLIVTLCVAVFLCGFSVMAYAGGGPEWEGGVVPCKCSRKFPKNLLN